MLHHPRTFAIESSLVQIEADGVRLDGALAVPPDPIGVVVFAHGSGSSRHSPRNKLVARTLHDRSRAATLLVDLLSDGEEELDNRTGQLRFDMPLLARRVAAVCDWVMRDKRTRSLPTGLFGASTGAAAALMVAADRPDTVAAVVSRGGRPDLAGAGALARVTAPTLLVVGGDDTVVLDLNRQAMRAMTHAHCQLEIVLGASHLFAEPGTLAEAADLAAAWFARYLSVKPPLA